MERDETKNNELGSTVSDHKPYGGKNVIIRRERVYVKIAILKYGSQRSLKLEIR